MDFKVKFLTKVNDSNWPHYLWEIQIGKERFEYKTGLGHATAYRDKNYKANKKPEHGLANSNLQVWLHVPQKDHVMHTLFSDSRAADQSFDDFCSDYGYSNDSLKALDIYRACAEIRQKLRRALDKEYASERNRIETLECEGLL